MGQTLENGVYLPSEGERNCYAGLKTNWEILDQKIADVTALQQAVAGALHRQIVASLPTTDIDPNTIYMILSGTSATENVYNEFMYVNNAWELIGTSATDLTNYYTKAEVDGKLLLKANASDLTSHTGDTTIHVTTADKATWNTVTSKANDSDVVHKSGDETVGGKKTFTNEITNNINKTNATITLKNSSYDPKTNGQSNVNSGSFSIGFNTLTDDSFAWISAYGLTDYTMLRLTTTYFTDSENSITDSIEYKIYQNGDRTLRPRNNNNTTLGETNRRWSKIYGTEYYYGSNNVEFSTKFVTTDTAQTISGNKTFSEDIVISNSDYSQASKRLVIRSSKVNLGDNNSDSWGISFNAGASYAAVIKSEKTISSIQGLNFTVRTKDTDGNFILAGYSLRVYTDGSAYLSPTETDVSLGSSSEKWKDVQTNKVNGLEPSSLSLPSGNANDVIDISSYITDLSGGINEYTAPANGWITVTCLGCTGIRFSITDFWADGSYRENPSQISCMIPICKNQKVGIYIYGSSPTVQTARFIPCQGNV